MTNLPAFRGKVFLRDESEAYRVHAYQYATTSFPEGTFSPSFILYAEDEQDLRLATQYARENNVAISIRSGGHQYLGSSSTSGRNIQIDLSGRESSPNSRSPFRQWSIDRLQGTLTLGVGLDIDDINKICLAQEIFFPHGECKAVHVGGHTNTGGISVISRTFGAMIDYLESFEIMLADGNLRVVKRASQDLVDRDLWFAVLGGSPGNFGLVTRITLRYFRDVDHPKARGIKLAWPLTRRRLERLLSMVNELNDDPNSDPDFNLSVITIGAEPRGIVPRIMPATFDDYMSRHYPNLVGEQHFHWGLPLVTVVGCWANRNGAKQDDSHVDGVLARFRSIPGMIPPRLLRYATGNDTLMDGRKPTPMSRIMKNLTWENPRVMQLSYRKLLYFGTSRRLTQANDLGLTFAQWLAGRIFEIESLSAQVTKLGLRLGVQAGLVGGPALAAPPVPTAMGNRDGVYWLAYDVFYNPSRSGDEALAESHLESVRRDIEGGAVGFWEDGRQRRLLAGPIREKGNQGLDEQWQYYFSSRADYDRLLAIKARLDPQHIFTPNVFGVGASTCERFKPNTRKKIRSEFSPTVSEPLSPG